MLDLVKILLKAGDGGHGRVSFRREKYVPKGGPDGGDGGFGGNVILRATTGKATLEHLSGVKEVKAQPGQPGSKQKSFGVQGEDVVVEVPVGTAVWLLAENRPAARRRDRVGLSKLLKRGDVRPTQYHLEQEGQHIPPREDRPLQSVVEDKEVEGLRRLNLKNINVKSLGAKQVAELNEPGQEIIICQGGFGGRGNTTFKSSSLTTPLVAEYGTEGEERLVLLELRMLADVGLVGFPNAGKSTLLSVVTKARPKVASYPFTTLQPQLGVFQAPSGNEYVMADIPGLIEGASQGKGLGYDFLRHVENCRVLLYLLALDEAVIFDEHIAPEEKAAQLFQQWQDLRGELEEYAPELLERPFLVGLNKKDVLSAELIEAAQNRFQEAQVPVRFLSAATREGVGEVMGELENRLAGE